MPAPYLVPRLELPGETYGVYLGRIEAAFLKIIDTNEVTPAALEELAFIVTEIPSDFDWGRGLEGPTTKLRRFLMAQTLEVQQLFFAEAMKMSPRKEERIRTFVRPEIGRETS